MSVLGRILVSSAERLDLPDLLSIDSYAAGDWKFFLKGLVGDSKPYILKGFNVIDPTNAIGTQSCSISVAESVVFYPGANAGSFFVGLEDGNAQAAPLVPELRKNAVNYVYLTLSTTNTSTDTRAFWDPDKDGGAGGEFTQDINTESILKVEVNVSTGSFPANTIPVAKVTVGPVVITAIQDARDLMFRLGTGGINPDPFNTYGWRSLPSSPYQRNEPPTTMTAGGVDPFQGADKNILTLKEWMDAIMSKLRELGGTTYWYEDTSTFSIISNFVDAMNTAFKSKGKWLHDSSTPGLITWTEDINIKITSDNRTYIIRAGNKTLADEQVMYLAMVRNQPFNSTDQEVSWTNAQNYINTVGGAVGLFANLAKGDYVKKTTDSSDKWIRVEEFYDAINLGGSTTTAALAKSVRLSSNYQGSTATEKGRYDKGIYLSSDVVVSDRDQAAISNAGGNFHWLAMRSDTIENVSNVVTTTLTVNVTDHDGITALVTATGAHGLVDNDRVTISGGTNFNGTYQVEVLSSTTFKIDKTGGPYADEGSITARYATVTTAARSTAYGLQLESANHGFNTDDTIIVSGTTNYNGSYKINVRSATVFTIPKTAAAATETSGLATLARAILKTEGAVTQIIQGEEIDIGDNVADNMRKYMGMKSLSDSTPEYSNVTNDLVSYPVAQGDDLTLALGQTIGNVNDIFDTLNQPSYDEFREIVASSPTGNQLLGPVTSGTTIALPNNSRLPGSPSQSYIVGNGALEIYLNGQMLQLGEAGGWTQVGSTGDDSTDIVINQQLEVGDFLTFRIDATGGPGSGSGGGGGGGTPGGVSGDIQYNVSGNFAGSSSFKIDTADGAINLNGLKQTTLSPSLILADNVASPTSIFNYTAATNNAAIIEYSVVRNGAYRTGRLVVAHDGSITSSADDFVQTATTGITFTTDISAGNVRVLYTSTNTGFAGTLKLSMRRWS